MAVIFSPITDDVLEGPYRPLPRHAFVMVCSGDSVPQSDQEMERVANERLEAHRFRAIKATDLSGTKDYLEKIIQAIRGCGFGVAVFSKETPAITLANIFFEVGICCVFGKPVIIVKSQDAQPPSDFVRTQWVSFRPGDSDQLADDLDQAMTSVSDSADYYRTLADVAAEADEVDYELVFERYKQAVLITDDIEARSKIEDVLASLRQGKPKNEVLQAGRTKLMKTIIEFLKLLPGPN